MPYIFRPPTSPETFDANDRLWRHYSFETGYSVLVTGATVTTYPGRQGPTTDEINAADFAYIGGHEYTISDAERTTLVTADSRWDNHLEAL